MKKYIFVDIDGTLYVTKKDKIPPSAIDALKLASQQSENKIFVCTGRSKSKLNRKFYDLPFDGYVYSCGAHIEINGSVIYKYQFPKKELQYILNFMIKNKVGFILDGFKKSFANNYSLDFYMRNYKDYNEDIQSIMKYFGLESFRKIEISDFNEICKISIFSKNYIVCNELMNILPENLCGFLSENTIDGYYHGEIYPKEVNKYNAIKIIKDFYKDNNIAIVAIGDSLNDLEMIKNADFGICMGNGSESVKKESDYITKDIEDDGLYYAFKHIGII